MPAPFEQMLTLSQDTTKTLAEVGSLLIVIAGVWFFFAELPIPSMKFAKTAENRREYLARHCWHSSDHRLPLGPVRIVPCRRVTTPLSLRTMSRSGTSATRRRRASGAGIQIPSSSPRSRAWCRDVRSTWDAARAPTPFGWPSGAGRWWRPTSPAWPSGGPPSTPARPMRAAAARIEWRHADLLGDADADADYPSATRSTSSRRSSCSWRPSPRGRLFTALAAAVRAGGALLVVGHHPSDMTSGVHRPAEPERFYTADDIAGLLDDSWTIVVNEARPRAVTTPRGRRGHHP